VVDYGAVLGRALWIVVVVAVTGCGAKSKRATARANGGEAASSGSPQGGSSGSANGGASGGGGAAGSGGNAGEATPVTCARVTYEPHCGTGLVGTIECSEPFAVSTAHHADSSFALLHDPPEGFPDLHAFGCVTVGEWVLPTRLAGELVPSFEEFPYVARRDDEHVFLHRGLPDEPSEESAQGNRSTIVVAGPSAVGWGNGVDLDDGLRRFVLHEAEFLNDTAERVTFELHGTWAERLYLHEGRPSFVFQRLDSGWIVGSLVGEAPLGVRPVGGGPMDFLLDSEPIVAEVAALVAASRSPFGAIAVSGADPEFSATRIAEHYGLDAASAERASLDPLSPEYLAAPVLALDFSAVTGWDASDICDANISLTLPYQFEAERTGLERVVFRLGRDSGGTPWLVTLRERGEGTCTYVGRETGGDPPAPETHTRSFRLGSSELELILQRLALPSAEHRYPLSTGGDIGRYQVFMAGATGTIAVVENAEQRSRLTLWQVALDASF
jgi:hypothetical protein